MKFIIPQNYKFKNRILGIIDYPTAILNLIWNMVLYFILKDLKIILSYKIFIFSALSFPVLLLTIIGFNNESPIHTLKYLIKYFKSQKVYLFQKDPTTYIENTNDLTDI